MHESMKSLLAFLKKLRKHPVIAVFIILSSAVVGIMKLGTDLNEFVELFNTEKPDIEKIAKNLSSSSPEVRIAAAVSIGQIKPGNVVDAEMAVRVLEAFINRRAAAHEMPGLGGNKDVVSAVSSLGSILRAADKKALRIRKPEFHGLNLSELELSDTYMRGVTFSSTSFEGSILDRADFSDALLIDVNFARVCANEARLSAARIRASCFEEAKLEGAYMDNLEVHSSDFNSARLSNSDLNKTQFYHTRLANTNFTDADIKEVDLRSGMELIDGQIRKAKNFTSAHLPSPIHITSRLSVCNPNQVMYGTQKLH